MNKVFLIGNLTRDPELTQTPSGVSVCHFSIAVNRPYSSQDGERVADYFNCTAWRALADNIGRSLRKGKKVAVSGSIQLRNYEDNQGVKRTAVDIIAQDVEFLSPRSDEDQDGAGAPAPTRSGKPSPTLQPMDDGDDIPF